MSELINHPPHYTSHPARCMCGTPIECIQVTEHMPFNIGNAIKYLWRMDNKGKTMEDMQKAIWYIHREMKRRGFDE